MNIPNESNFPSSDNLFNGFKSFMTSFDNVIDGFDIDLENSSRTIMKNKSDIYIDFINKLKAEYTDIIITMAPETDHGSLDDYSILFNYVDIISPQFYNNGPNQLDGNQIEGDWNDFNGDDWSWRESCLDRNGCDIWQFIGSTYNKTAWEYVIEKFKLKFSLNNVGLLVPANLQAAEAGYNKWNFNDLKNQVKRSNINYIGTWCIEQDKVTNYNFSKTIGQLLN